MVRLFGRYDDYDISINGAYMIRRLLRKWLGIEDGPVPLALPHGWKSWESVPRDGTPVLVWGPALSASYWCRYGKYEDGEPGWFAFDPLSEDQDCCFGDDKNWPAIWCEMPGWREIEVLGLSLRRMHERSLERVKRCCEPGGDLKEHDGEE